MRKWIAPALIALILVVIGVLALAATRVHAPTGKSSIPTDPTVLSPAPARTPATPGAVLAVCRPPHIDASRGVCAVSDARMSTAQASSAKVIIDATRLTTTATLHVAISRRQPDGTFAPLSEWTESATAGTTSIQYPLADVLSSNVPSTPVRGVYRITLAIGRAAMGAPAVVTIEP